MPRPVRTSVTDGCYHVLNRGNGRAEIFHKDEDYDAFLRLIGDACERLPMRVLGYLPDAQPLPPGAAAVP